jgi:hypothetical protein
VLKENVGAGAVIQRLGAGEELTEDSDEGVSSPPSGYFDPVG